MPRPAPTAERALFRDEVLAHRKAQWLGTVLLAPRLSHRLFALFGALAVLGILALLFGAQYTRKERIAGWLVPESGVIQVHAPLPALVTRVHVAEGAVVHRGDPLATLSQELRSTAIGGTQAAIGRRIDEREASLEDELAQQQKLLEQQRQSLADRLAALQHEEATFGQQLQLLARRVAIANESLQLQRVLLKSGFISEPRLRQTEAELLEQQERQRVLERDRSAIVRERLVAEGESRDLPLKVERESGLIRRTLAQLAQERAESEATREIVVAAPQDGVVTAILAVQGSPANTATPLMAIVPQGVKLQAYLYAPSRSMGFVAPGQRVLLRYEAYPYQRFGHHEGLLASVSRTPVAPAELPLQLAGLLNGSGEVPAEPMYRLTVDLPAQTVTAYGKSAPLQPGMVLKADVLLDTRRLYEWVLDPLYTITGRVADEARSGGASR